VLHVTVSHVSVWPSSSYRSVFPPVYLSMTCSQKASDCCLKMAVKVTFGKWLWRSGMAYRIRCQK